VGAEQVKAEIRAVFGSLANQALCIAQHESGFNPSATHKNSNNSWDVGVMQLNDVHGLSWAYRLDYKLNIQYAYQMRLAQGNWGAWTTHTVCGV
jgi:hypothetical protein